MGEEKTGEQLRKVRKEKRMTIVELAERIGCSQSYLVRIERNEAQPTQEQIEVIKSFIEGKS